MCLYPRLIRNPKYKPNKKNKGIVPIVNDERVLYVAVGCGKCMECRKQKAREWRIRLLEDIKTQTNGKFITLTFSNESIKEIINYINNEKICGYELDNKIATTGIRLFLERWRKQYKKSIRHWFVTELGHNGTENIHLHGILWTNETKSTIEKIWKYGFIWEGDWVNSQTVNYTVKYIYKRDEKHKNYNSIILTSAGIGNNYTNTQQSKSNKFKGSETIETYRTSQGYKIAMPKYWRNKLYDESEREQLWLNLLEKNERWIGGEKVKADDTETIQQLQKYYRQKNKQLGYGSSNKDYNQIEYENNRRKILQARRISAFGPK